MKLKAEITGKRALKELGDWPCLDEYPEIRRRFVDVDYDESLLVLHIATELCYYEEMKMNSGYNQESEEQVDMASAKLLSGYMMYLLVKQPEMMSSIAGIGENRFNDTCAEATKFFSGKFRNKVKVREVIRKIFSIILLKCLLFPIRSIIVYLLSLIICIGLFFKYLITAMGKRYHSGESVQWGQITNKAKDDMLDVLTKYYIHKETPDHDKDLAQACKDIFEVET